DGEARAHPADHRGALPRADGAAPGGRVLFALSHSSIFERHHAVSSPRIRSRVLPEIGTLGAHVGYSRHAVGTHLPESVLMGRLWHSLACSTLALTLLALAFPAHAQSPKLEAAYVVLGPHGAVARAVLPEGSPAITIDGAQRPMSVRAQPDAMFRVLVCEALIPRPPPRR